MICLEKTMFQTYDRAKMLLPWAEMGTSAWTYAELLVNQTWFFADCKITDGINTVSSTYLLSKSAQIGDLISNPDISIQAIYIVSPPYNSNRNSWEMDQLNKVSYGVIQNEDHESKIEIYELANGKKYYSSCELENESDVKNIKVMFDLNS
jgi:hypothetical protein